jgi:hypothetical protein
MTMLRFSYSLFLCLSFLGLQAFGLLASGSVFGQGCSDAGFCTMGAMKPNQALDSEKKLQLRYVEISQYYGKSPFETHIWATSIDLNFSLKNRLMIQVKMPYMITNGRLGSLQGFGDLSLSATYLALQKEKMQVNFSLGAKVPTNASNQTNSEGLPLPMYYQTSLGTYDLIGGVSLLTPKWLFATGIQIPTNTNQNEFTWAAWRDSPLKDIANLYPPARGLRRGSDVMLRAERNFRLSRLNAHIGILAIYRLNADQRLAPNAEEHGIVVGSEGLVVNLIAGVGYQFNTKTALNGVVGYAPSEYQRATNPDGLARANVFTLALRRNI